MQQTLTQVLFVLLSAVAGLAPGAWIAHSLVRQNPNWISLDSFTVVYFGMLAGIILCGLIGFLVSRRLKIATRLWGCAGLVVILLLEFFLIADLAR